MAERVEMGMKGVEVEGNLIKDGEGKENGVVMAGAYLRWKGE